jgi:lipopolysaccharide/colanic/teichoic acid biosynthesis glycosyltransferase
MPTGRRYRVASVVGVAALAVLAVRLASTPFVQSLATLIPVVDRLPVDPAAGHELLFETGTTLAVVLVAFLPLYVPRPRRSLDTVALAAERVLLSTVALAAVGYFDYTYRLPRLTLVLASAVLFALAPAWFLYLRRSPDDAADRVVIVGDDPNAIEATVRATDVPVLGYVSPPGPTRGTVGDELLPDGGVYDRSSTAVTAEAVDGREPGASRSTVLDRITCLGGLSRLDEVFVDHDVDAAVLAFSRPDRAEFFGALEACHAHGVVAKVHRDHADAVLTNGPTTGPLVDIDIDPWDPVDRLLKRAFDVAFAAGTLLALAPVLLAVAVAVRAEDGGPVLYSHERTAAFGGTFRVRKFRSMTVDAESGGARLSEEDAGGVDPRVTRVGRVIRRTHLDELPQLWSVLRGEMSVVGPRPERPELDTDMERAAPDWRRRWFVEPGLTGLAQVEGTTAFTPEEKLRYDVEYIRRQSLRFDLRILLRQLWHVLVDVRDLLTDRR